VKFFWITFCLSDCTEFERIIRAANLSKRFLNKSDLPVVWVGHNRPRELYVRISVRVYYDDYSSITVRI